ncbi:tRNA lysidine(34) synthetase TilS [Flavobacterium sp.]|jgi:tRNA(Ile)-lysidine synthase|uniref:tRNA lysidine(34) synthetase TilS n=1 Tax=Flavobacterium sp. TaxID=239 RepID=UPI0037C0DBEC
MLTKFQNHLTSQFSFLKGKKLFIAVSGGIDSIVLVDLLHKLEYEIAVLHCNFSLRGAESDGDEAFVKSFCKERNIEVLVQKFDTKQFASDYKLSIQVAARKLRYDWFYEQLKNRNFDFILTAHHLNDSLETFLINFSRGTGLDGLTGIPAQNDKIIRPLLPFSREEIELYAEENAIQWREDSSNSSDKYLRNKLRHDVIPILKEVQPNLLSSFENTIKNLQQAQSLVNDASRIIYKEVVTEDDNSIKINLKKLTQLANYQAYLYQWLKDFGFVAWNDIYDLVSAQSGKKVLSPEFSLLKDRDFFILTPKVGDEITQEFLIEKEDGKVNIPLKFTFCNVSDISVTDSNSIFVDENKLQFPLTLRKWQEGDFFYPFGMTGKKKLSKYFKDEKFSLIDKSTTWILCSDNQIVWIINKRMDDRFKVNNNTTTILKITIT